MNSALRTLTEAPAIVIAGEEHRLAPRNLALLVRLRYAELPVPRTELGAWFWHGRQWRPNLSTALRQLRQVLSESVIPGNDDPVRLGTPVPADTDLIEAAATHPTRDAVRAALDAYSAPFLWGLEHKLKDTREFVPWILELRERYRTSLADAVEARCRAASEEGMWDEIVELTLRASERGISSEAIEEWRRTAERVKSTTQFSVPAKPARPGWRHPAVMGAAVVLFLATVLLLGVPGRASSTGPRDCRPGEAVGHLVRKEFSPEFKTPLGSERTYTPQWVIRNDGRCRWTADFRMQRVARYGEFALSTDSGTIRIGREVAPGDTITITHEIIGPPKPGDYGEDWVLVDDAAQRVLVDGQTIFPERFQVLPIPVPTCAPDSVRTGVRAASHPEPVFLSRGQPFTATWTIANTGRCIWQPGQIRLRFDGVTGSRMSDPARSEFVLQEPIPPSEAYTFEVPMRAPATNRGDAREQWSVWRPVGNGKVIIREPGALRVDVRVGGRRRGDAAPECKVGEEQVRWIRSERLRDHTLVTPGVPVRKAWTLLNEGECTWPAGSIMLRLQWTNGPRPNGPRTIQLPHAVPPGATYTFAVPLIAPDTLPVYEEHWQVVNRSDTPFRFHRSTTLFAVVKVRRD